MKLWPSRAFWRGFASAFTLFPDTASRHHFDAGPYRFTRSRSPEEAARLDAEAIASDWRVVGDDMREAMNKTKENDDRYYS